MLNQPLKIDDLLTRIVAEVARCRIPKCRLAVMAGLHANTLKHFGKPNWAPNPDTIRRIEDVLWPAPMKHTTPPSCNTRVLVHDDNSARAS